MALINVHEHEHGPVRPGDVIFSFHPHRPSYPIHVGVSVEDSSAYVGGADDDVTCIQVCGIPMLPSSRKLGTASWRDLPDSIAYHVSAVGQLTSVDELKLREVVLLARHLSEEHSLYADQGGWGWRPLPVADLRQDSSWARPLFIRGTCAQLVEYLYESVGLDLVDQSRTCPPGGERDVLVTVQLHAFWSGVHPLAIAWDERLRGYPSCLSFGTRQPPPRP